MQSIANLVNRYNDGVNYHIFCSNKDLNGEKMLKTETDQWLHYNEYTSVWYASRDVSNALTTQLRNIKPDVLFIIGLFSRHYNIVPLYFSKVPVKILSPRGMLHAGAFAQKKIKKQVFLWSLKLTGIQKKVVFHATDADEEQFIKDAFGEEVKIKIAKNFGRFIERREPLTKNEGSLKLVTVALISPMKNYLKILQALANCSGEIEYNIYGPVKDPDYWKLCRQEIMGMPKNITVNYHGETAPENVTGILAENHVFIMPSESENFGHALYEALSAGKPIITSKGTPWNGLEEIGAGMNIDLNVTAIQAAIQFFSAMNIHTYSLATDAAVNYISSRTNEDDIKLQYKALFSGRC